MARTGVSYTEVAETAAQLMEQGKNPTVEQVRYILKTGSSTTIARHLRQWRDNHEFMSDKENLPAEFIVMMKGLWGQLINHSQQKITAIEEGHQQTVSALQQETEKYKANNQRWQKLYDQWIAEKNQSASDKLALEQALEFAHKENTSLHAKLDGLIQQLQDKQERIDELHRLHKQSQENLEHYREAAREQRSEDLQQHEQQKQQLQSEIKNHNDQLIMQREKMAEMRQEYQILQQSFVVLEKNYLQEKSQCEQLKARLEESEKNKMEHLHDSKHWKIQHQETKTILADKSSQLVNLQGEIKLLSQQLMDNKQILTDTQDQNKLLNHDKWMLAQEKAQLEGQLKQMQKMVDA